MTLNYDTKQSDGETPALGNVQYPIIAITPSTILTWISSTC